MVGLPFLFYVILYIGEIKEEYYNLVYSVVLLHILMKAVSYLGYYIGWTITDVSGGVSNFNINVFGLRENRSVKLPGPVWKRNGSWEPLSTNGEKRGPGVGTWTKNKKNQDNI